MTIRVQIQREAVPILRQMAKEAGVYVPDMVEIAVYNLIAVYQQDRGLGQVALDSSDGMVLDRKLGLP